MAFSDYYLIMAERGVRSGTLYRAVHRSGSVRHFTADTAFEARNIAIEYARRIAKDRSPLMGIEAVQKGEK